MNGMIFSRPDQVPDEESLQQRVAKIHEEFLYFKHATQGVLDAHESSALKNEDAFRNLFLSLDAKIAQSDSKNAETFSSLIAQSATINALFQESRNLFLSFQEHMQSHDQRVEKLVSQIDEIKQEVGVVSSDAKKALSYKDEIEKLKQSHSENQQFSWDLKSRADLLTGSLEEQKEQLRRFKEELADLYAHFNVKMDGFYSLLEDFQSKIAHENTKSKQATESSLETVFASIKSLSSANELKEDVLNKIQIAELDAQNAVIKSRNSEQQIKILERKVENILLQLKKYELTEG